MKKMMKNLAIFIVFMTMIMAFKYSNNVVYADFIGDAADWYSKGGDNIQGLNSGILSELSNIVNIAGTAVISIVTVVLGIKYMIGGVTGKSEVKQQLISLLVACLLFFGWSNLSSILITGASYNPNTGTYTNVNQNTQLFIFQGFNSGSGIASVFARVFAIVLFFAKIVAVVSIMVIGAKYILSGADGKAELKQKGPMFIIGILMIFSTLNILTFISNAINQAL